MFPRLERDTNRVFVCLVASHRIDGKKTRQERIGSLGSIAWAEPFTVSERVKFWTQLDARFAAIGARRPGIVSLADEEMIRAAINERIPRASAEDERRLRLVALIQRDMAAAFDADNAANALEEAGRRLLALARGRRDPVEERTPS
jgi:hypothetical protein